MYDQVIRRFVMEGKVSASKMLGVRATYTHHLKDQMRVQSYLPILDFDNGWFTKYLPEEDAYEVRLVEQAIYYGKDDIDKWDGWISDQLIPMTRKQSKTSSTPSD